MKSDQMGTGHNNPSPRELPLSNQARFNLLYAWGYRVALCFPSFTRSAQHRALARAGIAHNKRQIPLAGDMHERGPLLVPKSPIVQRRILRR